MPSRSPSINRLPGSTGAPTTSTLPPAASSARGTLSCRSMIAVSPASTTRSGRTTALRSASSSRVNARSPSKVSTATKSVRTTWASRPSRRSVSGAKSSSRRSLIDCEPEKMTATREAVRGSTRSNGPASLAMASAAATLSSGSAKGTIFTVAAICRSRTGSLPRRVATVRPSIWLSLERRSTSTRSTPRTDARRLFRPEAGPAGFRPGPDRAAPIRRAARFSSTSFGSSLAT